MRKLALLAVLSVAAVASAAVLFDGGPLVNYPGQGYNGYDASAIEVALSENIYGYGAQKSAGNRMADDFVVGAGGWTIDQIKFFTYQTNSTTTSTITEVNVRIWDQPPNTGNVGIVWGDTTTNRLASTTWSQIYRSISTGLTNTARPIMDAVANIGGLQLNPGTYWVDVQYNGTLTSGPWQPPVSILGQTGPPNANAKQYTSTGWANAVDSGNSQPDAMPFVIYGVPEPASLALLGLALLLRRR